MRMRIVPSFRIIAAIFSLTIGSASLAQTEPPTSPPQGEEDGQLVVDVTGGQRAALPIAVPVMPTNAPADTAAPPPLALPTVTVAPVRSSRVLAMKKPRPMPVWPEREPSPAGRLVT